MTKTTTTAPAPTHEEEYEVIHHAPCVEDVEEAGSTVLTVRVPHRARSHACRWLLYFNASTGKPEVKPIPFNSVIMPTRKVMNLLVTAPGELNICRDDLIPFYGDLRRLIHERARWMPEYREQLRKALSIS